MAKSQTAVTGDVCEVMMIVTGANIALVEGDQLAVQVSRRL